MAFIGIHAQKISVHVPQTVSSGETFRLEYTINSVNLNANIKLGNMPEELDVVYGPSISEQQSYSMVNGHTSSSSSTTYTYMLIGKRNGTFVIPPAHITMNGKTIASKAIKVNVVGNKKGNNVFDDDNSSTRQHERKVTSTGNDLFIRVTASKYHVHEQEPVVLTYKVYTLVDLTQLEGKMPQLDGFHSQEVPLPQQKTFHTETINGKTYRCVTWSQYIVYPQMTGVLEIPSITFKGIVVHEKKNIDPFEAFFNGGSSYVETKREIKAPSVKIKVEALPEKPNNFSGGVGQFNIKSYFDKKTAKTGEALTLKVEVNGIGNLKLMKEPTVEFPKDFEHYNAKIKDKTRLTSKGVEGSIIYEYLTIPQNEGTYVIPEVSLVYFDTSSKHYKTIKTQSIKINVGKGDNNNTNIEGTVKEQDIRDIKRGAENTMGNTLFYNKVWYWTGILLPLILFFIIANILKNRVEERKDIAGTRGKKANKVATRRLKKAKELMERGEKSLFYEELLHTMWGYFSDKMNVPNEMLSRDKIITLLREKSIDDLTIDSFINAIDECEKERYAPNESNSNMNKTYSNAMGAIINIEDTLKEKDAKNSKTVVTIILLLLCISFTSNAKNTNIGDVAYDRGNYKEAVERYEEILNTNEDAVTYYNLGNAYYRLGELSKALVNYNRALVLSPNDDDIKANIDFVNSKTSDDIDPKAEMFFVTWYKNILNTYSANEWAVVTVITLLVILTLMLILRFCENISIRKISFCSLIVFALFFIMSIVFSVQHVIRNKFRNTAVLTSTMTVVRNTPSDSGLELYKIKEGAFLKILDKSLKGWYEIETLDGRTGWIEDKKAEII